MKGCDYMSIDALIEVLSSNGIGIVCVAFMIYFINTSLKDNNKILDEIQKTLITIQATMTALSSRIDKIEDSVENKK